MTLIAMKLKDDEYLNKMCRKPLDEEVFQMVKEIGGDIFNMIVAHNQNCLMYGYNTYDVDYYKDLLNKYGFTKHY